MRRFSLELAGDVAGGEDAPARCFRRSRSRIGFLRFLGRFLLAGNGDVQKLGVVGQRGAGRPVFVVVLCALQAARAWPSAKFPRPKRRRVLVSSRPTSRATSVSSSFPCDRPARFRPAHSATRRRAAGCGFRPDRTARAAARPLFDAPRRPGGSETRDRRTDRAAVRSISLPSAIARSKRSPFGLRYPGRRLRPAPNCDSPLACRRDCGRSFTPFAPSRLAARVITHQPRTATCDERMIRVALEKRAIGFGGHRPASGAAVHIAHLKEDPARNWIRPGRKSRNRFGPAIAKRRARCARRVR